MGMLSLGSLGVGGTERDVSEAHTFLKEVARECVEKCGKSPLSGTYIGHLNTLAKELEEMGRALLSAGEKGKRLAHQMKVDCNIFSQVARDVHSIVEKEEKISTIKDRPRSKTQVVQLSNDVRRKLFCVLKTLDCLFNYMSWRPESVLHLAHLFQDQDVVAKTTAAIRTVLPDDHSMDEEAQCVLSLLTDRFAPYWENYSSLWQMMMSGQETAARCVSLNRNYFPLNLSDQGLDCPFDFAKSKAFFCHDSCLGCLMHYRTKEKVRPLLFSAPLEQGGKPSLTGVLLPLLQKQIGPEVYSAYLCSENTTHLCPLPHSISEGKAILPGEKNGFCATRTRALPMMWVDLPQPTHCLRPPLLNRQCLGAFQLVIDSDTPLMTMWTKMFFVSRFHLKLRTIMDGFPKIFCALDTLQVKGDRDMVARRRIVDQLSKDIAFQCWELQQISSMAKSEVILDERSFEMGKVLIEEYEKMKIEEWEVDREMVDRDQLTIEKGERMKVLHNKIQQGFRQMDRANPGGDKALFSKTKFSWVFSGVNNYEMVRDSECEISFLSETDSSTLRERIDKMSVGLRGSRDRILLSIPEHSDTFPWQIMLLIGQVKQLEKQCKRSIENTFWNSDSMFNAFFIPDSSLEQLEMKWKRDILAEIVKNQRELQQMVEDEWLTEEEVAFVQEQILSEGMEQETADTMASVGETFDEEEEVEEPLIPTSETSLSFQEQPVTEEKVRPVQPSLPRLEAETIVQEGREEREEVGLFLDRKGRKSAKSRQERKHVPKAKSAHSKCGQETLKSFSPPDSPRNDAFFSKWEATGKRGQIKVIRKQLTQITQSKEGYVGNRGSHHNLSVERDKGLTLTAKSMSKAHHRRDMINKLAHILQRIWERKHSM